MSSISGSSPVGIPNQLPKHLHKILYTPSSRSIPANIAEAWIKRKYPKSFISKLLDAMAEEAETEVWADMSLDFKYIESDLHDSLITKYQEVARMLNSMINYPDKFCSK